MIGILTFLCRKAGILADIYKCACRQCSECFVNTAYRDICSSFECSYWHLLIEIAVSSMGLVNNKKSFLANLSDRGIICNETFHVRRSKINSTYFWVILKSFLNLLGS